MQEPGVQFNDSAESVPFNHLPDPLHGRKEDRLRGTAHQHLGMRPGRGHDRFAIGLGHPEGLFAQQMFAGLDGGAIHLPVQVVREGNIDCIHIGIRQDSPVVLGHLRNSGEVVLIPPKCAEVLVAERDNLPVAPACPANGTIARPRWRTPAP